MYFCLHLGSPLREIFGVCWASRCVSFDGADNEHGGKFSRDSVSRVRSFFRLINDLLAPLSLFCHEFQQNSQVFTDNIKRSQSTQIYIKISPFKSLIYKNYFSKHMWSFELTTISAKSACIPNSSYRQ
jgi:hypothetical protein